MKVLISGAGIAGLTAAFWLRRFGFTPTIVERAESLVVGGYKIDVRGSAVEVLRRMGMYDAVVASSTHMQGSILVDRDGAILSRMDADAFGHRTGDDIEIVRGTLCRLLRDHTADVKIRFSDAIDSIAQTEGQARVTFAGGHSEIFDLVIGADGLHSNVRTIAFGEEFKFLRDLGIYLCVFSVPNYLDLDRVEVQYSEVGRIAQIWSTRDSESAKACFGFAAPAQPIGLRDRPQQENALRIAYDGVKWEVPRLLDMMSGASDWYFDVAVQTDMPSWTKGRVALAGDAGYCP
jgi:2-polyprenyl-6-methoxyphenol hydroxylase-like FAD-dependent oxidoreductase